MSDRSLFISVSFELCGRLFGQLAILPPLLIKTLNNTDFFATFKLFLNKNQQYNKIM
jgi:hypothetical protein